MNKEVLKDLNDTLKMINDNRNNDRYSWMKKSGTYGKISQCYAFSNENLSWYYPLFDIKNNDVLTVCGSGDQVLSALLYDAKSVDVFDSNKLAYYHLMLKIGAIKSLDFEEFINFYTLSDFKRKDNIYYEYIEKNIIDDNVREFWKYIITNDDNLRHCFIGNNVNPNFISNKIPYLDKEKYYLLKDKLDESKIRFENTDIFNILRLFGKEYSFINLSNILYYILDKDAYVYFISCLSKQNLKANGSILLNYYWDNSLIDEKNKIIYQKLGVDSYECDYHDNNQNQQIQEEIKVYTKS